MCRGWVCAGGVGIPGSRWGTGWCTTPCNLSHDAYDITYPSPPPPLPGQSNANKNIIFWQLLLRAVRISRTQCAKTNPHVLLMKISCRFIDNKVFLVEIKQSLDRTVTKQGKQLQFISICSVVLYYLTHFRTLYSMGESFDSFLMHWRI